MEGEASKTSDGMLGHPDDVRVGVFQRGPQRLLGGSGLVVEAVENIDGPKADPIILIRHCVDECRECLREAVLSAKSVGGGDSHPGGRVLERLDQSLGDGSGRFSPNPQAGGGPPSDGGIIVFEQGRQVVDVRRIPPIREVGGRGDAVDREA